MEKRNENKEIMNNMKPVITDKYEMSYIRKMGNPKHPARDTAVPRTQSAQVHEAIMAG